MRPASAITLLLLVTSFSPALAQTPINYKVAFVADTDYGLGFQAVLDMVSREGVDAVVHAGDLAYSSGGVAEFAGRIESTLGPNFPYFASLGNHEVTYWSSYQAVLEPWATANGITWDGDYGTQSSHEFQGIHYVMVAPGDIPGDHAAYVRDRHAASDAMWKISVFHRNMENYQLETKTDDTGWGVYEESRRAGAIVTTAHAHLYGRTYELADVENAVVSHFNDSVASPIALLPDYVGTPSIDEGRSFVFVSGLGGRSVRAQARCIGAWGPGAGSPCDVWASVYTLDQAATWGALIGEFNHDGDETLARFYFMNVNDEIVDEFYTRSGLIPSTIPADPGDLVASAVSSRRIDLTWTDVSDNENGFKIERSTDGGTLFAQVAQVGANVISYSDAGRLASTEYCYRVRAANFAGSSGYTATECATTLAPTPPADPIDLAATVAFGRRIDLIWTDQADDEEGFTIERSTDGGVTFTALALTGADVTAYSDVGVPPLTEYCYRVRAFNVAGSSAFSNADCATTPEPLMGPPEFQEVVTGGATGSAVSTSGSVSGVDGDLYLAAISAKTHQSVSSVTGLGLAWTPVAEQCGGRGQTGVSVWSARGTPTGSGAVSATLAGSAENSVIAVSRYTNADPFSPVGNVVSANTNGVDGACSGGVDNSSYSFGITTELDSAVVYSVAAHRNLIHTPGAGYTERTEFHQGIGGEQAGESVQDRTVGSASTVTVDGSFGWIADWAVVAIEIKPGGGGGLGPPAPPSGLLASAVSVRQIDLGWTGSGDEDGFRVERSTDSGGTFLEIAQVGSGEISYSDTSLVASTEYCYRVRGYRSGGNSDYSNAGCATTLAPPPPPTGPEYLVAAAVSTRRIDLSWTARSTNEDGFKVERSTDGGSTYVEIAQVGVDVTSYSDTGLLASTEYCYRVRAYHSFAPSVYSNYACATTPAITPPADPINFAATVAAVGRIGLSWTDQADDEDGFTIERSTDGGGTFTEIALVGANSTGYSDGGLDPVTEYCYRVWAFNVAGSSGPSGTSCATTPELPADPPALQEVVTGGGTGTTVSTSGSVGAVAGDLYLAAISAKAHQPVSSVTGLGLTWTLVAERCGGRGQTGVSVWSAQGVPTGSGAVSATLDGSAENAVIAVCRYTNAHPFSPVGNVVSGNTNGVDGACVGGIDNGSYSLDITTETESAVVYSFAGHRNLSHTPGTAYTEHTEIHQGSGGTGAAGSVQDRVVTSPSTVSADGSFSWIVDWAVVAIEIRPSLEPVGAAVVPVLPTTFAFRQNHPNPFGPSTTISYDLPEGDHVRLKVYDVRGARVAVLVDGYQPAGRHRANWSAISVARRSLPSGVYFARLQVGGRSKTIKMLRLR